MTAGRLTSPMREPRLNRFVPGTNPAVLPHYRGVAGADGDPEPLTDVAHRGDDAGGVR